MEQTVGQNLNGKTSETVTELTWASVFAHTTGDVADKEPGAFAHYSLLTLLVCLMILFWVRAEESWVFLWKLVEKNPVLLDLVLPLFICISKN